MPSVHLTVLFAALPSIVCDWLQLNDLDWLGDASQPLLLQLGEELVLGEFR